MQTPPLLGYKHRDTDFCEILPRVWKEIFFSFVLTQGRRFLRKNSSTVYPGWFFNLQPFPNLPWTPPFPSLFRLIFGVFSQHWVHQAWHIYPVQAAKHFSPQSPQHSLQSPSDGCRECGSTGRAGLEHRLGPHLLSAARMYTLVTAPRHTRLSLCPRLIYSTSIILCCRAVSQNDNGPLRLPRVKCNFWYLRGGELTPCTNPDKLAIASLPPSHQVLAFLVILLKDAAQEPSQSASQGELTAGGKAACDRLGPSRTENWEHKWKSQWCELQQPGAMLAIEWKISAKHTAKLTAVSLTLVGQTAQLAEKYRLTTLFQRPATSGGAGKSSVEQSREKKMRYSILEQL